MKTISNSWKCSDVSYSEKLAVFCARLKDFLDTFEPALPADTALAISFKAGEDKSYDFVCFGLKTNADDYNACTLHTISGAKIRYKEEYFVRTSNNTYNCVCTAKSREGILCLQFFTSDGGSIEQTKGDDIAIAARRTMVREVMTHIMVNIVDLLSETICTSYFTFSGEAEETESDDSKKFEDEE